MTGAMKFTLIVLATASVSLSPPQLTEWVHTMAEAEARAQQQDRPILVYCWADGSDYCTRLYQETLSAEDTAEALQPFVLYSAKHGATGTAEVFERYGVKTLPTMLFVQPAGEAEDLIQGFIPTAAFVAELARIRSGKDTVSDLERRIREAEAGSASDIEARWLLAGKVQALGQNDRHDQLMASIRSRDPNGETIAGGQMMLNELYREVVGDGDGAREDETPEQRHARVDELDLTPLYTFAKVQRPRPVMHDAWERIGNLELRRRDMQAAFDAYRAAWKCCPDAKVVSWSNRVARWIIDSADERTSKEKKFALELARSALRTLRQRRKDEAVDGGDSGSGATAESEAYCISTVAACYHVLGKKTEAVKAQRDAIALHDTEEYRAQLARMLE